MSDTYLELHNLESSLTDFAVSRIVDETLQNSPECQLPDDNPVSLVLPDLDVLMPELACDYNIDLPLVPLPHFCSPSFSTDILFSGCDGTAVTGDLSFSTDGTCHYSLDGEISVCATVSVPCSEGYTATGTITATTESVLDYVQLSGALTLELDGSCGFKLTGSLLLNDNVPDLSHVCTTSDYTVEFEVSDTDSLVINVVDTFKITLYPKITVTLLEENKCKIRYKIEIDERTAAVVENIETKTITYCTPEGVEETRKFLCIPAPAP